MLDAESRWVWLVVREALREKLAEGGGAVEAAVARGSELADEQRELKALLDVARGERDRLRSEASAAHGEAGDLRAALREKGDVLLEAERRCAGLQEELDTRCSSVRRMQADKEAAEATAQQVGR
jgi:chromosome segregation ATPase